VLRDSNNDGKSLSLSDGNLALRLASGDLSIRADVLALDASNDSRQAGALEVRLGQGSVNSVGAVRVMASQQAALPANNFALAFVLEDTSAADRAIRWGAGAQVTAVGGDILMDTRPALTASAARRNYVQEAANGTLPGAAVRAYNSPEDLATGRVTLNGTPQLPTPQQRVGSNRWLAIVADGDGRGLGALEQMQDLAETMRPTETPVRTGLTVNEQFGKVFGDCDEFDPKTRHRCTVNSALKAFLSHWLVGGELPTKQEQN
jgi:hypothetical protein